MKYRLLPVCFGLVLAALTSACSSHNQPPPPVAVSVEHQAAAHNFHVTWNLPQEARMLIFLRGAGFREGRWIPSDTTQRLYVSGGYDVIEAAQPVQSFSVDIHEGLSEVVSDYSFLTPFSDGASVMFTGHVGATSLACPELCTVDRIQAVASEASASEVQIIPDPSERLIINGDVTAIGVAGQAPAAGAMVYFGHAVIKKMPGFLLLQDATLPAWIADSLAALLPRVLDLDTRHLGFALAKPPVVYLPYDTSSAKFSRNYLGSVIGSSMVLSLTGSAWSAKSPDADLTFSQLIAHESFHLWNAGLFRSDFQPGGLWLHEGSADAFSYLSLDELGIISKDQFDDFQSQALNRCVLGVSNVALVNSANQPWSLHDAYDCGALIENWVATGVKNKGSNLWAFWSELFKRASQKNGSAANLYTHQDFFDLVQEQTPASTLSSFVQQLVGGQFDSGGVEAFVLSVYSHLGIPAGANDQNWPNWYSRFAGETALSLAITKSCGEDAYFVSVPDGVTVFGGVNCSAFKPNIILTAVNGAQLWTQGVAIYDSTVKNCGLPKAVIPFSNDHGLTISVACPMIAVRPPFLSLNILPTEF